MFLGPLEHYLTDHNWSKYEYGRHKPSKALTVSLFRLRPFGYQFSGYRIAVRAERFSRKLITVNPEANCQLS